MDPTFDLDWIKERRQALALTQMQLASQAGVSLPTLQNIEAGKGNPSWDILVKLRKALGYSIRFEPQETDWSYLSQIGVPLTDIETAEVPNQEQGRLEFKIALHEFVTKKISYTDRQNEAFCAFLWALRDHYPSRFAKYKKLISSKRLDQEIKKFPLGRLIKLRRMALSRMDLKIFA